MSTEVRFYHLQTQSLEQALPALLSKATSGGRRAVVRFEKTGDLRHYDDALWTYTPESFLPHGISGEGHETLQPILLTATAENPNKSDILILCNQQSVPENIADFSLCCDFLDGTDEDAVTHARARWKAYKEAGHEVTYWQQTETGGWDNKA